LAKCRDTGELIAVGTACKMLKGKGLVISSDTPDNPLYDRSKQIERRLIGGVKEDVGIDPPRPLNPWSDLRGMPRDITGDLAPVIGEPITQDGAHCVCMGHASSSLLLATNLIKVSL